MRDDEVDGGPTGEQVPGEGDGEEAADDLGNDEPRRRVAREMASRSNIRSEQARMRRALGW